jgi:Ca2+-binding RTX toxin-like protein
MRKYLRRRQLGFESLESRRLLASTASFNAITGALSVTGDTANNNLVVTYQLSGSTNYLVVQDSGVNLISFPSVPASSVKSVTVAANSGNDSVSLATVASNVFTQLTATPVVDGGSGNDTITGSKLADLLYGVDGIDTLIGIDGADYLYGGNDGDGLYGDYGNDSASVIFDDILHGEAGNDFLYGDQGKDSLYGTIGNDSLYGGTGNDLVSGGDNDDQLIPGDGVDSIYTGTGNNTIYDLGPFDVGGSDIYEDLSGFNTLDFSQVTDSAVEITMPAEIGQVLGTPFDDTITGNNVGSIIYGNGGNDWLIGGDGDDQLTGGDGHDRLSGKGGSDIMDGGAGHDTYTYQMLSDLPTEPIPTDSSGIDLLDFAGVVTGGAGLTLTMPVQFEYLVGTSFDDKITGNASANEISGGPGNDQLFGSDGNDSLRGDDGDDYLEGGTGVDSLLGGNGTDTWDFDSQDSFTQ